MSYFCLRRMLLLFALGVSITRAIAQTSATVTLEKAVINAGENIKATVALDTPSPCRAQVDVYLVLQGASPNTGLSQGRSYFVVSGIAAKGDTKVSISSTTPFDNPGGEFAPKPSPLSSGLICDGYSMPHNFAIPNDLHLTVVPVPDTNTYPTQANVVLNVSQKQFLETKAHNLDKLYGRFSDGIAQYPAMTQDEQLFLVSILDEAQRALDETENEYRTKILKPGETIPIFFDDFRFHYQDLETRVKGRKIAEETVAPHLVLAQLAKPQLKKRPGNPKTLPAPPSTTLNPDANETADYLKDNARAYRYVEDTGGDTFTTSIVTYPPGARVYFQRTARPEWKPIAKLSNVQNATLPMAYLDFTAHKDNCDDAHLFNFDPWTDPKEQIEMEFSKCR